MTLRKRRNVMDPIAPIPPFYCLF